MDSWQEVLEAAGPQGELARALGVTTGAVYLMRMRGWVEPRHWRTIIRRLEAAGHRVTVDQLLDLAERAS